MQTTEIRDAGRGTTCRERLFFGVILVLVALQMILFLYLVTVGWSFRSLMLPPGDPEIMVRTRTVFANALWLGANAVALAFYLLRPKKIGRYVLLAILAFDVANSVFAALGFILSDDPATGGEWLVAAIVPLLAMLLLWHQPGEGSGARPSQSLHGGR